MKTIKMLMRFVYCHLLFLTKLKGKINLIYTCLSVSINYQLITLFEQISEKSMPHNGISMFYSNLLAPYMYILCTTYFACSIPYLIICI